MANNETVREEFGALGERVLWLSEDISPDSLWLVDRILEFNAADKGIPPEKREPIKIIFFSPGGCLYTCYSIVDIIELSQTPVYGYNIGQCSSAAAFIYLGCDKRFMTKNSHVLLHKGSASFSGSAGEIINQVAYYDQQVENLSSFVIERTTYTPTKVRERITTEWYINFEEALANGVCHGAFTMEELI